MEDNILLYDNACVGNGNDGASYIKDEDIGKGLYLTVVKLQKERRVVAEYGKDTVLNDLPEDSYAYAPEGACGEAVEKKGV